MVTSSPGLLYMFVKSTTPHNDASFLRTGLGRSLAAALVATGCLAGCDAPSEPGDRALELDDEDLTDEEIDELVAQEADEADEAVDEADEAQEGQAPAITETVADVLAALPPAQRAALHGELTADQLERPIEITALERAVDVDGNGVLDGMDELTTAPDPVAIGEMACATQALTDPIDGASVAMTAAPNCGYAYDGSTSPNTSYDTAGCPHQYVTEVTGTSGEPLSFYWDWHGANLDQTLCATAHASLTAYGAYFSWPFSINWVKIGTTSVHGVWQNGGLFSYCGWAYDTGKGPIPSLGSNHGYFKVRTATQATGFIFKQRVEGGIVHGDGPC